LCMKLVRDRINEIHDTVADPEWAHLLNETTVRESRKLRLHRRLNELVKCMGRLKGFEDTLSAEKSLIAEGSQDAKENVTKERRLSSQLWKAIQREGKLLFTKVGDVLEDDVSYWESTWAGDLPNLPDLEVTLDRLSKTMAPVLEKGRRTKEQKN